MRYRLPATHCLLAVLCLLVQPVCGGQATASTPENTHPADTQAQPATTTRHRMPLIRMHGAALRGAERKMSVEEIDRTALLVTWKISDPYKRQENRYTGILLKDLVNALAPEATNVRLRAINDYITVFSREEWENLPVMLATRDGDTRMSIADKGPARIVFQQTRDNEMAMQVHAPKWIWQVVDVEFQSR